VWRVRHERGTPKDMVGWGAVASGKSTGSGKKSGTKIQRCCLQGYSFPQFHKRLGKPSTFEMLRNTATQSEETALKGEDLWGKQIGG